MWLAFGHPFAIELRRAAVDQQRAYVAEQLGLSEQPDWLPDLSSGSHTWIDPWTPGTVQALIRMVTLLGPHASDVVLPAAGGWHPDSGAARVRMLYVEAVDGPWVEPPGAAIGPGWCWPAPVWQLPAHYPQPHDPRPRAGISVTTALFIFGLFIGLIIFAL